MPRSRMVHGILQALLAMTLILAMSGLGHAVGEGLEEAVHELTAGHSAHDEAHPEGLSTDPDHDCFGLVHVCSCCGPQPMVASLALQVGTSRVSSPMVLLPLEDRETDGVRSRVDRPPSA